MLHLGKRAASPLAPSTPKFSDLVATLPTGALPPVPAHFGHGFDFGTDTGWRMLANGPCDDATIPTSWYAYEGVGDCAWAGPGHEEMEAAKNARRPVPVFTCLNVAEQYASYLGLASAQDITQANDNGSDVQEVLAWRQTKGLLDAAGVAHKIGIHVALTPGDFTELWQAAYLFETVGIGVNLQQAQEDQFNASQPWSYVEGSEIIGGHYIPVMGPTGLVSWAKRVGYTETFYTHLNDESYAYIDPLRYSAITGEDAEDYTDADLEKYIGLIAKQKAA